MIEINQKSDHLRQLKEFDRQIHLYKHVIGLLQWDQETYMPQAAVEERSEQLALLEGEVHERQVSNKFGDLIGECKIRDDLEYIDSAFLREVERTHERAKKLPRVLVTSIARQSSVNHASWVRSRKESDFSIFRNDLDKTLRLTREKADHLGFKTTRYDPLLDEYEPWMTTAELTSVIDAVRNPLVKLLEQIKSSSVVLDDHLLRREYDVSEQRKFSNYLLKILGFSLETGRLDVSAHPFSTTLGASDSRLTTRFHPQLLSSSIFGTIHECGHGLHGLGVSSEIATSALGDGTSLGICESQSRLWENMIGRGHAFWEYFYPNLKTRFKSLSEIPLDQFMGSINAVNPSLIRVEADEVTYNLHILLRFSLERRMVDDEIDVDDLPEVWRDESRKLLGISPERDSDGVLQDIHWSMFAIGYFPTYTLGNLYSAQFYSAMKEDMPDLDDQIRSGTFSHILTWLRENIHNHGRSYSASEICSRVTGEPLNPGYFIEYLYNKFGEIYNIT